MGLACGVRYKLLSEVDHILSNLDANYVLEIRRIHILLFTSHIFKLGRKNNQIHSLVIKFTH